MKTVGTLFLLAALVMAVCFFAHGQSNPPGTGTTTEGSVLPPQVNSDKKAPKAGAKEVEQDAQMKILKAKVALQKAQGELDQLQIQFSSNKQRYDQDQAQIQQKAPAAQQALQLKQQILKSEEDAACKAAIGAEADKYTYDEEKGTCSPKAEPAPPTPSPAKK